MSVSNEKDILRVTLDEKAFMPLRTYSTDAGLDLRSPCEKVVHAYETAFIDTGVHIELPKGKFGLLASRSGMMKNRGITTTGVIDCSYRGSIGVVIINHSDRDVYIKRGDKITQLIIMDCYTPVVEVVDKLDEGDRGFNGFGSSGR